MATGRKSPLGALGPSADFEKTRALRAPVLPVLVKRENPLQERRNRQFYAVRKAEIFFQNGRKPLQDKGTE